MYGAVWFVILSGEKKFVQCQHPVLFFWFFLREKLREKNTTSMIKYAAALRLYQKLIIFAVTFTFSLLYLFQQRMEDETNYD